MTGGTLLSGSLHDFGLVEVLQVMELGSMTGAIHLKQSPSRTGILYFNDGKLASCSEFDPGALTLGDVLQQLGMAAYQQIEQAFSQQLQDAFGKRIGERLVAMNVISDQQLKEALRTKVLWTVRELSLWEEGTYEFIASPNVQKLLPYGDAPLDIEVMRITMEMIRYADEWQTMRAFLPQGMRTMLQMNPSIPRSIAFEMRTLELLMHANYYRRVRRIATALRRPEMEVAREAAQLVQQRLLLPYMDTSPRVISRKGRDIRLPDPAERLRLESFALFDLIVRMEQEWDKRRTPMEQLPALVVFVNWTMDALAATYRANGVDLDAHTLRTLMVNEKLSNMGTYEFHVVQNHIDVENFTALCYNVVSGDMKKAKGFYEEASNVLRRLLCAIFDSINSRVANPRERLENQEVWEAMFDQFALSN